MTPNSPNEAVVVLIVFGLMATVGGIVTLISMLETKRLRKRMQQRREQYQQAQAATLQELWLAESRRRQELERIVAAQAAEHTPVSVPITHCERRERRRRFLPLEDNPNAAR